VVEQTFIQVRFNLKPYLNEVMTDEKGLSWLGTRSFWMLDVEREFYQCLLLKRELKRLLVYVLYFPSLCESLGKRR